MPVIDYDFPNFQSLKEFLKNAFSLNDVTCFPPLFHFFQVGPNTVKVKCNKCCMFHQSVIPHKPSIMLGSIWWKCTEVSQNSRLFNKGTRVRKEAKIQIWPSSLAAPRQQALRSVFPASLGWRRGADPASVLWDLLITNRQKQVKISIPVFLFGSVCSSRRNH